VTRKVAFVTGASRGIGRASALALAERGFDVVVTARTVVEGRAADGSAVPGSIETTARQVRERGREALAIRLDLLDRASIDAALDETFARWGRIDVLLNNGIYTGGATLRPFLDLDEGEMRKMFEANVFAQAHITRRVLPSMLERGSGSVIDMVSSAGLSDPPAAAGKGGWGWAYAATKAAFNRLAGVLAVEHRGSGVLFHSLEPGLVITEAMALYDPEGEFAKRFGGAPTEVPAAVIAWLATSPDATHWNGKTVFAQKLALELGLIEDWRASAKRSDG
jgi:NAD(P)-dependent dehydrogenase (short-subunit alcohol dehydrogenase family)